jgi:hypothetical protein
LVENCTPETPTPSVNGQSVSSPARQSSRSMLSLAPAAKMFGATGLTASPGSFCLFCENAFAPANWSRLPTVTSLSPTMAKAGAAMSTAIKAAKAKTSVDFFLRMCSLSRDVPDATRSQKECCANQPPGRRDSIRQSPCLGLGQSLTPPSPAEELSATVGGVLVLVAGRVCVPGGWPWSRRRAGSCPAPSRGVNWPRNECSILLS